MKTALDYAMSVMTIPVLPVGKTTVTVWMILYVVLLLAILIVATGVIQRRVLDPLLSRSSFELSVQNTIALIARYSTIALGAVIILNTAGIEMTALTVVAGAVGLGLSLGLQTVAKNVVGGVMLLGERMIRIGDRIRVGDVSGTVTRIALRATTILTDDALEVVVPNSDFMNEKVVNWTRSKDYVRMQIPVAVSGDSDPKQVSDLLLEAAKTTEKILAEPPPEVWFDALSEKTLTFILRISTRELGADASLLKSHLHYEIHRRLKENAVQLAEK